MPEVKVGTREDFEENSVVQVKVGDRPIAIYHIDGGEFYATSDICTHGHSFLSEGWITDECAIECALHGGCFDIRTGKGLGPPIEEDLETFPIRIDGDDVLIVIEE